MSQTINDIDATLYVKTYPEASQDPQVVTNVTTARQVDRTRGRKTYPFYRSTPARQRLVG